VTRGFACNKGLAGDEIHRDPDRVDYPLRRTAEGGFERVSWEEAICDIAQRLAAIKNEHGASAIAPYIGNPTAFNTLAAPAIGALFAQLGVRRSFSSGTQDCANKFAGSEAVFGSSTMHPIPDLVNTDFLLSFGANPRVSHASFISIADPIRVLKSIVSRGGKVVHVNPREIENERTRAETEANWGQLARTLGFAQSPGVLKVFGFIPGIGLLFFSIASIWQLVAMVIAIRQALEFTSTWRAVGVAIVGFIPYALVSSLIFALI